MDGVINVYKEKGYTSHDVVAIVRKTLNIKKVGHTGTLDPDAEGVLPVCIGSATKLADYIMAERKSYRADRRSGKGSGKPSARRGDEYYQLAEAAELQ